MPNMKRRSMAYPRNGYQIIGGYSAAESAAQASAEAVSTPAPVNPEAVKKIP